MKEKIEQLEKKISDLEMKLLEVQLKADKALDVLETITKYVENQHKMNIELVSIIKTLTEKS
jgi:hypothetical protein